MNTKTFEEIIPYLSNVITNKNFVKSFDNKVSTHLGDFAHDSVKAVGLIIRNISNNKPELVYDGKLMPYGHLEELAKNPTVPNFKVARKELTLNDMAKIILLQTARETLDVLISEYGWATTGDVIKTYYLIDAELSTTWGFEESKATKNWNYFKFWNIPGIEQPWMDNNDNYPHGYYSYAETANFSLALNNEFIKFATENDLDLSLFI